MPTPTITIATRESPLALWQADHIHALINKVQPDLQVQILGMTTRGDQILDSPLAKVGGKGLFVKELEYALLDGRADIAVHSAKDMPMALPEGLALCIVDQRAEVRDALVLPKHRNPDPALAPSPAALDLLGNGAIVGTSSLRRKCQLLHHRPDLRCQDLRGNVNTRLAKLDEGQYEGIILASAGLIRLGLASRISAFIAPEQLLPAVGQGALAVEYRQGDERTARLLDALAHRPTTLCVTAERAMSAALEGGCQVPIAGYAQYRGQQLTLTGRVGAIDGSDILQVQEQVSIDADDIGNDSAISLGQSIASALLGQGADRLLKAALQSQ